MMKVEPYIHCIDSTLLVVMSDLDWFVQCACDFYLSISYRALVYERKNRIRW